MSGWCWSRFSCCALFAGNGHEIGRIVAFVIFAVACITDRFDGLLARNYGMATEFGEFVDPVADKALIGAALIGLSMLGDLPWWMTVVILVREVGVTAVAVRDAPPRRHPGKPRRQTQDADSVDRDRAVHPADAGAYGNVAVVIMAIAIVLTVLTGVDYVVEAVKEHSCAIG